MRLKYPPSCRKGYTDRGVRVTTPSFDALRRNSSRLTCVIARKRNATPRSLLDLKSYSTNPLIQQNTERSIPQSLAHHRSYKRRSESRRLAEVREDEGGLTLFREFLSRTTLFGFSKAIDTFYSLHSTRPSKYYSRHVTTTRKQRTIYTSKTSELYSQSISLLIPKLPLGFGPPSPNRPISSLLQFPMQPYLEPVKSREQTS